MIAAVDEIDGGEKRLTVNLPHKRLEAELIYTDIFRIDWHH